MFTVPNPGGPFVADGVLFDAQKHLVAVGATQATASAQFLNDGTTNLLDALSEPNWHSPTTASIGSSYWVRATLLTGDSPSTGTMNTWIALSTDPTWTLSTTGVATFRSKTSNVKLEFSTDSGGSVIVAIDTLHLEASVDNS